MLDYLRDKKCIDKCLNKYQNYDSNEWLIAECPKEPFIDTKYEIPKITLDMTAPEGKEFTTEFENVKSVYSALRFLSDSNAADERVWAGLCLGPFYNYVRYRWDINSADSVKQHFFFGYNNRRSYTRNAIARLWWIGRLTYDKSRPDHWEMTKYVCSHSDIILHIIERGTSNNIHILRGFIGAMIDAEQDGVVLNTNDIGMLAKYLNLLGGSYILDAMPEEWIKQKIRNKIDSIIQKGNEAVAKTPLDSMKKGKAVRSDSILLIENIADQTQLRMHAKKHKQKTKPKSLVGLKTGESFSVGNQDYRIISIYAPDKSR